MPPAAAAVFAVFAVARIQGRAPADSDAWRAADCVFNALEGDSRYHRSISVLNSNTYFRSCIFRGLSEERVPETPGELDAQFGALHIDGLNATLALENCTLTDIVNPLPLVVSRGGRVYSDNPDHVVRVFLFQAKHHPQPHIPSSAVSLTISESRLTGNTHSGTTHR